jgi:ubiquinone/menaquinone biosynthesis C-methylase UbiE
MIKEFDEYTKEYKKILDENLSKCSEYGGEYYQQYKIQYVKNTFKIEPKRILDFGCGIGIGSKCLKEAFPNAEIIGIDISEQSIKYAKEHVNGVDFYLYRGKNLQFNENFDYIYANCVFHHINKEDRIELLKELKGLLKRQGLLTVFEHNPVNPITKKLVQECIFDRHAELIYAKEFKEIMQGNIEYLFFVPRYKIFRKILFIENYLKKCFLGAQYCFYIKN